MSAAPPPHPFVVSSYPVRLTVAAVAQRLGVAPGTLRTWDRRYGVGPSEHRAGAHRRYTPGDVARLEVMQRLVLEGAAPADAAEVALARTPAPRPTARSEGGRVLAMSGSDDLVRGLGRAAMALDAEAVTATLTAQLDAHGVVRTWDNVLRPLLVSVGHRWARTGEGVDVEHLLSDCVSTSLRQHASALTPAAPPRPVLLAGAPDDQHVLPLHVLAAALAERGHATRVLGPALPMAALRDAVRRTGPAAVFVWSQTRATGSADGLAGLPEAFPRTSVLAGGPGWDVSALPDTVRLCPGLVEAADLVESAIDPGAPIPMPRLSAGTVRV